MSFKKSKLHISAMILIVLCVILQNYTYCTNIKMKLLYNNKKRNIQDRNNECTGIIIYFRIFEALGKTGINERSYATCNL